MKKLFKAILNWIKNIEYFLSYTVESIEKNLDKDRRAVKIAMYYPIAPEDVRDILDVTDVLGMSDETVKKLLEKSCTIGLDGKGFVLDIAYVLRKELASRVDD